MHYEYPLTILTPTYNRAKYLKRLYESLNEQTVKSFQWLVIDDGSTDETEETVHSFTKHTYLVNYKKKPNGGKHTALNYSHPYIKGEMVCIVDSDDWLLPNAVEEILKMKQKYFKTDSILMFVFLKGYSEKEAVCNTFPDGISISNRIDFIINAHRNGDCCEVVATDELTKYPFPEYADEKFLGEGYLWNRVGFKCKTAYINKVLYICEYLEGGLSKSGRRLRIKCPKGGMENCNSFFYSSDCNRIDKTVLRKEAILFVCYGKFANIVMSRS